MMWEDQYACWLHNKSAPKGMELKKRMLDWGGCVYELVGPGDEEDVGDKERPRALSRASGRNKGVLELAVVPHTRAECSHPDSFQLAEDEE